MNTFEFNNNYYRQLHGTAMSTRMAPSYANLFMSSVEQKFLNKVPHKPLVWWRYIDYIFMIWSHGTDKLQEFIDLLNKQHSTIKFTSDISKTNIPFLDVMVHNNNGKLSMIYMLSGLTRINTYSAHLATLNTLKCQFPTA